MSKEFSKPGYLDEKELIERLSVLEKQKLTYQTEIYLKSRLSKMQRETGTRAVLEPAYTPVPVNPTSVKLTLH